MSARHSAAVQQSWQQSPERRAAHSAKMKLAWAIRKAKQRQAELQHERDTHVAGNLQPGELTAFEKLADKLTLPQGAWAESKALQAWARKHANHKYVPEKLLEHWGITVRAENF